MPDCGGIADGLLDGHATPAAASAAPAPGRTVQHLFFFSTGYREYKFFFTWNTKVAELLK